MTMKATSCSLLLLVYLAFACVPATGQLVTSELIGTVRDASGAVVQNAAIDVTNLGTSLIRRSHSDASGTYDVAGLQPGRYEIKVQSSGFATFVRQGIVLLVNQTAVADITLQIGSIQQQIVVTDEAPMLDTTTAGMSGVVTASKLRELPLNGRDLWQLTLLQPGVNPSTNAGPSPFSEGGITKASVQGTRPTMNNNTLDGGDINDPGFNVYPGGPAGVQIGVEAVQEYRVLLNTYSAEYGRNAGANVQLVSRSGTNDWHGSLYEFVRNAALDAKNYFDVSSIPPFARNQFGVTLGGPIRRNKTFFFVNYEGLQESKGITTSTTVPDAEAHLGYLPSASNPGTLVYVGVNPAIEPFLSLYPMPNGPSLGNGTAIFNTSGRQPTTENYGLGRIDHQFSQNDQIFLRYVADYGNSNVPFQSTLLPGFNGTRTVGDDYAMLSWTHVINPSLLNEAKLSYDRTAILAAPDNSYPLSLSLVPGSPLGSINISDLPLLGNNLPFPLGTTSNTFEVIDNVVSKLGNHYLKWGADVKRMQVNGREDFFISGQYTFADLSAFGIPAQSTNPALESFLEGVPYTYFGVDPSNANSNRHYRQTYLGFYIQDDWHVRQNLTLNLGLRWEYSSNPSEVNNKLSNIQNLLTATGPTVGPIWKGVPLDLWSPRIGFEWSPGGSGRTVVRGGFGIMRDQLWANLYFNTRFYEPFYSALLYILPKFEAPPQSVQSIESFIPPQNIGSFGITYTPQFPYYMQYNLNVQQELANNTSLTVGYVGSRGVHLVRTGEANELPFYQSINPNLGSIPLIVTDANSVYNSLQVSLLRRFAEGLSFQASYTFSKSMDDQSGPFPSDWVSESGVSQNFYDRTGDYGRSSFDRRNVFIFNALYDLPFGPGGRWGSGWQGVSGTLAGGWQVATIIEAMSGLPFTVTLGSFDNAETFSADPADRPNLKPGVNPCSSEWTYGNPSLWFNPAIFTLPPPGQYGNAGRNIMCGPSFVNFDLSFLKMTKLTERFSLQFRAEIYNLFNHPNFNVPVNTQGPTGNGGNGDAVFIGRAATLPNGSPCTPATDPLNLGCGIVSPNVGRIFSTVNSSRQIQFGLKLIF